MAEKERIKMLQWPNQSSDLSLAGIQWQKRKRAVLEKSVNLSNIVNKSGTKFLNNHVRKDEVIDVKSGSTSY